ncbi:L-cysteine desulfhydrase [Vitis vinifera]|uniref:L-cysteine desulfhydrase n=1 Tax=Vitis vinifera TaxID=29760 RepID=A0A438IY58_VITVI|nr:L-cysteine desulfhydrase [Vitis vinifera]
METTTFCPMDFWVPLEAKGETTEPGRPLSGHGFRPRRERRLLSQPRFQEAKALCFHIRRGNPTRVLSSPAWNRANQQHGSFGSCPASIIAAQKEWQLRFLQQPDDFYFNHLRKGLLKSRTVVKSLINADSVDEVSLIDNATTAAAIVLQQIGRAFAQGKFQKGDVVVMLHCAFQSVKKSIQAYVTGAGGSVIEVQLPFPLTSKEEIVSEFRKGLEKGKSDGRHVRQEGVDQVFVDAAHAIGSVPVDVKEIGADFYGQGITVHSLLFLQFLEFVNRFEGGIEGIMMRNHEIVVKMGEMLAKSWGTNLGAPPEMCASMIMVGLPSRLFISSEEDAMRLRSYLRQHHGIEVPLHYQAPSDVEGGPKDKDGLVTGYARISHQVYNSFDDYCKFRDAINQLVEQRRSCKMLFME